MWWPESIAYVGPTTTTTTTTHTKWSARATTRTTHADHTVLTTGRVATR